MSGWGRISFLIGVGVLLGAGCGGRTGALEDEYGAGASAAQGGNSSVAGKSGRAGTGTVAGSISYAGTVSAYGGTVSYGGTINYAGAPSYGGYYPTGGAYPYAGYGGYYPTAGSYPVGGYYGFGGTFPVGGYYGGGFPVGGYGGFATAGTGAVDDCLQCIGNNCAYPFSKCLTDFGCISILSCMQSTGCQAFQCYSDQFCRTTIDQWGGPTGQPMVNLLQTFACAVQSGCQCN